MPPPAPSWWACWTTTARARSSTSRSARYSTSSGTGCWRCCAAAARPTTGTSSGTSSATCERCWGSPGEGGRRQGGADGSRWGVGRHGCRRRADGGRRTEPHPAKETPKARTGGPPRGPAGDGGVSAAPVPNPPSPLRDLEVVRVDGARAVPAVDEDGHPGRGGAGCELHGELCEAGGARRPVADVAGAGAADPDEGVVALHPSRGRVAVAGLSGDRQG